MPSTVADGTDVIGHIYILYVLAIKIGYVVRVYDL